MRVRMLTALAAFALLFTVGCNAGVNRSFRVADGETVDSGFNTVNGSIRIGRDAEVKGSSHTVNGRISVDGGSTVGALGTVNGSIRIDDGVTVDGDLDSVNGGVHCGSGTQVEGDVSTVNGDVELDGAVVDGKVETINGEVTLRGASRVKSDVVIGRNRGSSSRRTLEIRLLDGSVVEGDVIVKARGRKVKVVLAGGSEVLGEIDGAEVVRDAGAAESSRLSPRDGEQRDLLAGEQLAGRDVAHAAGSHGLESRFRDRVADGDGHGSLRSLADVVAVGARPASSSSASSTRPRALSRLA